MAVWEYKVISSGKGGFATPALMESFLNQLGKEEWEIIHFHTPPDNPLAFQGLARRTTQRDWTLEDAAAAAARAEAEKLRAEFEAKFRGAGASGAEERPESLAEQKAESDDGLRRLRDTEHDRDADADEDEGAATAAAEPDEWDQLAKEEELPTFFEAIQPLMRRNPRGAGMSVGVDHLAKKWGMSEDDLMGALKECGFVIPEDEDDKPVYIEYDGDLFWVNVNRRGEYWVNTKEKPRAIFKAAKGNPVAAETPPEAAPEAAPAAEPAEAGESARPERAPARPERKRGLPEGTALLERLRPLMRRDRGQGLSGSVGFLCRALKCKDAELIEAFAALGLTLPGADGSPAGELNFGDHIWSLDKDQRGGIWIHGRKEHAAPAPAAEGTAGPAATDAMTGQGGELSGGAAPEPAAAPGAAATEAAIALSSEAPAIPAAELAEKHEEEASQAATELVAILRPLLKETRTGVLAGEVGALAVAAGRSAEDLLNALVGLGLRIPEKARERAATIEVAGESVSLTRNAKDEVWLNVKAAGERRPRRARRGPANEPGEEPAAEVAGDSAGAE